MRDPKEGEGVPPPPAAEERTYSSNLLDRSSEFINDHLRAFRAIPWVLGGVGAVLVVRYGRMFRRFRRIADIPQTMFVENQQLSGVVTRTHWDSIDIWHTPLGTRLLQRRPPSPCPEREVLRVGFGGVAVGRPDALEAWLSQHLSGRRVKCRLLSRDQRVVQCVVHTRSKLPWRRMSVNELVVSGGFGGVCEPVQGFRSSQEQDKFVNKLTRRETEARRKGRGMWAGHKDEAVWRKAARLWRKKES